MHRLLPVILFFFSMQVFAVQKPDSFHVYFNVNDPSLNKDAQGVLSSLIEKSKIAANDTFLIIGYADNTGTEILNDKLSSLRARNVKEYLTAHGIPLAAISLCIGKGAVKRALSNDKNGFAADRKVDIIAAHKKDIIALTLTTTLVKKSANFNPVLIAKAKKDDRFVLDKVYFYTGRRTIKEASQPQLEEIFNVLTEHPAMRIKIEGYVCCIPPGHDAVDESPITDIPESERFRNDNCNLFQNTLSRNRAWVVYHYLMERGISEAQLDYEGFGGNSPIVPLDRPFEQQEVNKRVEIKILEL